MAVQKTGTFQNGRRLPYGEDLNNLLDGRRSTDSGETATGTTLATAFVITNSQTQFSTAASNTGAVLPSAITLKNTKSPDLSITNILGKRFTIWNDGASPLKVYAPDASTIDGTAGATGVTLTNARAAVFTAIAVSAAGVVTWKSNLLGAVSS